MPGSWAVELNHHSYQLIFVNVELYQQVFENNQKWVTSRVEKDPEYFSRMAKGQSPEFLYIGCSDSRVQPEDFMSVEPGHIFVHRNIANVIPNNDISSISVIQYAVEHLGVKHIIVCGHYGCGGVKAAVSHQDFGKINIWLRNIQDVYRLHRDELNSITDEEARHRRLVDLNVREQCLNVMKMSFVQHRYFETRDIQIHGWVYDIENGLVHDLQIDMDAMLRDLELYRIEETQTH